MRAFTVTSRLEPVKSMSPTTMLPSAFSGVTARTFSSASTLMDTLGLTSSMITESSVGAAVRP